MAFETAARRNISPDYRPVAELGMEASLFSSWYSAPEGWLTAHTLLSQLTFLLVKPFVSIRRWLYGAASVPHLILDATKLSRGWEKRLLWPLMGSEWSVVNILPGSSKITAAYHIWVWQRFQKASQPIGSDLWWIWLLEIGGVLVLMAFAYRNALYEPPRLRRFLTSGNIGRLLQ